MREIIIIFISVCIMFISCNKNDDDKQDQSESAIVGRVSDVSSNDLAQVLLFIQDSYERTTILKKDFYNKTQDKQFIDREITAYKKKLKGYRGKTVQVLYSVNRSGDKIIQSIQQVKNNTR